MYVYQADTYCDSCGEAIRVALTADGNAPEDPSDEYSFDSDDFPKSAPDNAEVDYPDHCASQGDCLEGIDLGEYGLEPGADLIGAETRTIGALLSDNLTDAGVEYLRGMLGDAPRTEYQRALHAYWRETFADYL